MRCPLQYYFERILRLPRRSVPSSLVLGSAMHDTLEHLHHSWRDDETIPWNLVQLYFLECWSMRESEKPVEYKAGETSADLTEQAIELLRLYLEEPRPKNIVGIERRCLVPLRNSSGEYLETPLLAVLDLVTNEDGRLKITEFKTAARAYSEFDVASSLQATCYVHSLWETLAKWSTVEYTVFVKTKIPKIQRLQTHRVEEDLARLGDIAENVERAVEAKAFFPIESPMNCSSCSYRLQCREWKSVGRELPVLQTEEMQHDQGGCQCSQS